MEMEIHHHIAQKSPHQHYHYPTQHSSNEYYAQHPYNSLPTEQPQFRFDEQILLNNNNLQVKTEQLDQYPSESPQTASTVSVNGSPTKMLSTASPPSTSTPPAQGRQYEEQNVANFMDHQKLAAFAFLPQNLGDSAISLNYQFGNSSSPQNQDENGDRTSSNSKHHDRKRPYPCAMCSSRFGSKMELEEHQNSHTGSKPFECDTCGSRFNRRSTLWNHKRIHSDTKPFSCTVCQMTFKWKNSLKCHKEMHMRKNETTTGMDNDIKLLTYATAAKKKIAESSANGLPPVAAIQTVSSRKKPTYKKSKVKRELQDHIVSTTTSTTQNLHLSIFGTGMDHQNQQQMINGSQLNNDQQHQDNSLNQQQLDLSQLNHNNLLMQAIYSGGNATGNPQQPHHQQLSDEALELMNSTTNLNLDLLNTPQHTQSLFLDNQQFLNDAAAVAMQNSSNMRLPTTFPMNILDFQQQLTDRNQQQQLSYIQSQQQQQTNIVDSNQQNNQNAMLNYQQRTDLLLDDMQNLYQQTALDPSLLLNTQHQQSHSHLQQSQQQSSHLNSQQQQIQDQQQFDYMLNGNPVYSFGQVCADNSVAALSTQNQQQQALNPQMALANPTQMAIGPQMTNMALASSTNMLMGNQGTMMMGQNFSLMDDMSQMTQEELQNLAKMLPYDNKW